MLLQFQNFTEFSQIVGETMKEQIRSVFSNDSKDNWKSGDMNIPSSKFPSNVCNGKAVLTTIIINIFHDSQTGFCIP